MTIFGCSFVLPLGHRASSTVIGSLLLGMVCLLVACASSPADQLSRCAPGLPRPWVEALTDPEDAVFEDFARANGAGYLLSVDANLRSAIDTTSPDRYSASWKAIEPALTRVRRFMALEYGLDALSELHQRFLALDSGEALAIRRELHQAYAINDDPEMEPGQKVEALRSILSRLDAREAPVSTSHLLLRIARFEGQRGNREGQLRALEECIASDARFGNHRITCQALGVLGSFRNRDGDIEGMLRSWVQGLQLAKRYRLPEQAGRLTSFLAKYYHSVGRLALGRELTRQAGELCERFGGSPGEIRFLEDWLELNAQIGCWDVVERDLRRADLLLERYRMWDGSAYPSDRFARIESIRARAHLAAGEMVRARELFADTERRLSKPEVRATLSRLRWSWIRGLIESGHPSEALEVLPRSLAETEDPRIRCRLFIESARAHSLMGEWEESSRALDAFLESAKDSPQSLQGARVMYETLRLRLARVEGNPAVILDAVRVACRALHDHLTSMDAVQEGWLGLERIQPLRNELHAIVKNRPDLGYALEMQWRRLPGLLGVARHPEAANSTWKTSPARSCAQLVAATFDSEPKATSDRIRGLGVRNAGRAHLLYRVHADSVERWCWNGRGLTVTRLGVTTTDLRNRVRRILRQIEDGRPSASGFRSAVTWEDAKLHRELHELATRILPPSMMGEAGPSWPVDQDLLLSPDGPLRAIPFGILNLSAKDYVPLVTRYNPIYSTSGGRPGPVQDSSQDPVGGGGSPDPGVIVADPVPAPGSFAWRSGLPSLDHGIAEARALHEWKPRSVLLERDRATKSALLGLWERASFLYFAAHIVRDPDASYLSYLPLSPSTQTESIGGVPTDDAYLDATDLQSVSLEGHPLVVLSACSSGAPYLVHGAQAPGLGESFIQAGASAVIQTCWHVEDEAASKLMTMAMRAWAIEEVPPSRALTIARRSMARDGEFTHPYYWGGVTITADLPFGEWH